MENHATTWTFLACIFTVLFILDTCTESVVAVSVLYVIPVLIALSTNLRAKIAYVGGAGIALIVASHAINPGFSAYEGATLANLGISLLAVVSTTYLSRKIVKAESDGSRSRAQIARISRGISMKEMTVSIVHEVSQPLAAISTNVAAAKRWIERSPPDTGETMAALERISRDAVRAAAVVDRLRQFMSNVPPAMDPVDLVELAEESVSLIQDELSANGVEVIVCTKLRSVIVNGDRILLQQIFLNLFSNAIDAMSGHAREKLLRIGIDSECRHATVEVSDCGKGVRPEMLARLFDPFFTSKAGGRGMGVGLAVSRSIAESHGGTMHASHGPSGGLTVGLVLPVGLKDGRT